MAFKVLSFQEFTFMQQYYTPGNVNFEILIIFYYYNILLFLSMFVNSGQLRRTRLRQRRLVRILGGPGIEVQLQCKTRHESRLLVASTHVCQVQDVLSHRTKRRCKDELHVLSK